MASAPMASASSPPLSSWKLTCSTSARTCRRRTRSLPVSCPASFITWWNRLCLSWGQPRAGATALPCAPLRPSPSPTLGAGRRRPGIPGLCSGTPGPGGGNPVRSKPILGSCVPLAGCAGHPGPGNRQFADEEPPSATWGAGSTTPQNTLTLRLCWARGRSRTTRRTKRIA